jgi:CheY-like chemotaxis protein
MTEFEVKRLFEILQDPAGVHTVNGVRNSKGVCLGLCISQTLALLIGSPGLKIESVKGQGASFSFIVNMDLEGNVDLAKIFQKKFSKNIQRVSLTKRESKLFSSSKNIMASMADDFMSRDEQGPCAMKEQLFSTSRNTKQSPFLEVNVLSCSCRRILVVDDSEYNVFTLKKKLSKRGYAVFTALNGKLALETVKQIVHEEKKCHHSQCRYIRLILMDVDMPVMNGLVATEQLKKLMQDNVIPAIPIVGCSAFDTEMDIQAGFDAGMENYLCKPVFDEKLDELLSAYSKQ